MIIPKELPVPDKREFWGVVDSTKLQCAGACMRKYFYEYVLGWRSDAPSNHLVFGSAWHEALEHLYKHNLNIEEVPNAYRLFLNIYREEFPENMDSLFGGKTPALALNALLEYLNNYATDPMVFKVLATEVGGLVPIADNRMLALKMDLVGEDADGVFILEHKTGSQAGKLWDMQWDLSIQVGTYLHGLMSSYLDTGQEGRLIVNGTFFYKKERKFHRYLCKRDGAQMLSWLNTVNSIYSRIEYEFHMLSTCDGEDVIMKAFPQNPTSCRDFGGCTYHSVCTNVRNPLVYAKPINDMPAISGFKYNWWNPLAVIKESVDFR